MHTVAVDQIPANGAVLLSTKAVAFAEMETSVVCLQTGVCTDLSTVDPGHSGRGHVDVDATLSAVDLAYS